MRQELLNKPSEQFLVVSNKAVIQPGVYIRIFKTRQNHPELSAEQLNWRIVQRMQWVTRKDLQI